LIASDDDFLMIFCISSPVFSIVVLTASLTTSVSSQWSSLSLVLQADVWRS